MSVPDRFEPLEPSSPFSELVGPLYMQTTDSTPVLGVRVGAEHANRRGRAHGGLLMTLADVAVSRATVAQLPPGASIATADLHISFLESVGEGDWLEAVPSVDRLGRSLAHVRCEIRSGGEPVARVLGTVAVRLPMPR